MPRLPAPPLAPRVIPRARTPHISERHKVQTMIPYSSPPKPIYVIEIHLPQVPS